MKFEKPVVGSRVSVSRDYFDVIDDPYSSCLPRYINRIVGTVVFVYERKLRVKWDLDNICNDVPIEAIIIELYNTEKQVLRESDDNEISTDFSVSPVAEDSTLPNSDHPKESQTPASIAVDTILSNSEIHLVSSNYLFNDTKCVTLF